MAKKPFAWSFSKLKNFETCALRHNEVDNLKNFSDAGGEALTWGNNVHKAIAESLTKGVVLPTEMRDYEHWVERYRGGKGTLLIEQKFAITRSFEKTTYFAPNVWYRSIGDVVKIDGPVGLVGDWKTGAIKIDSVQLMLMAQCLFSHFPELLRVRSEFIWLAENVPTTETYTRQDIADSWIGLMGRVDSLEAAYNTNNYPAKPGGLCKRYCPVRTCQFHGKGNQ